MKYGFYSEKAAQKFGSSFYFTGTGKIVEVTNVSLNVDGDPNYKWDDTKYVGTVTAWAKDGKPNKSFVKEYIIPR
jgi:hypothetical protein